MRSFDRRELNHLAIDHELPLVRALAEFAYNLLCDHDQNIKEDLPAVGKAAKLAVLQGVNTLEAYARTIFAEVATGGLSLDDAQEKMRDECQDVIDNVHERIESIFESMFGVEV